MATEPLRKIIRAGLYNPDTVIKRVKEMKTLFERQHAEGDDAIGDMLDMLEQEIDRFERQQSDKGQRVDGPTRETVRNMREDPVLLLSRKGVIDKSDEVIIEELRMFKRKHEMGLIPPGTDVTGERVDNSSKGYTHPVDRFTTREMAIFDHVWKPWVKAEQKKIKTGKRGRVLNISHFDLVFRVIENNEGIRKIETQERVSKGTQDISKALVSAIRRFGDRLYRAEHEGKVPRRNEKY